MIFYIREDGTRITNESHDSIGSGAQAINENVKI
jgi:hypothetical protein